jgi:hypothetical protein
MSQYLQEKPHDRTADKSWMPNMLHKFPSKTFLANHVTKLTHTQSKIIHKYSSIKQVCEKRLHVKI